MATMLARERAVLLALEEARKGVREVGGNNRGPRVETYQRADGLPGEGYAWCASFVNWCFLTAGRPLDELKRSASVGFLETYARGLGWLHAKPARGDVFCWRSNDGDTWPDHTGFVVAVNRDGSLRTVEGNTSSTSVDEGDGVYVKTRPASFAARCSFIRVPGQVPAPKPKRRLYAWAIRDSREVIQALKERRRELKAAGK